MATLDTLSNLITNAKQTPSGKVEWTDTSLKGIQDEVKLLFSQNGAQVTENIGTLSLLDNESSQLVIVTEDATVAYNGVYFWNLTAVSSIFFPAASNGYWNILEFGVLTTVGQGYIPYSNLGNLDESYLKQTTNEIKMEGGSFVANNSTSAGPYFQCGDTDSIGNDVIFTVDDKIQTIFSKKGTSNLGIRLDLNGNIHLIGNLDARKQLSIDGNNSVYALGDAIASKGLRIDTVAPTYKLGNYSTNVGLILADTSGYLGTSTWSYNYSPTTLVAGNSSIRLYLDDSTNSAQLGDSTKGLFIDLVNTTYLLGVGTNGLVINTTGTYTLGSGTKGLDLNTTNDTYKVSNGTKGLFINTVSDVYKLGNFTANTGLVLNGPIGYLGSATFGYNVSATNLSVGNTSIELNIDDTSKYAFLGVANKGLFVDTTAFTFGLGNSLTGVGVFVGPANGFLGSTGFGYNFTPTTLTAGNSSINLTLNDTTNIGTLGNISYGFRANMSTSVLNAGSPVFGLTVDLPNAKIQLNSAGYGIEVWDNIKSVYTYGLSGIEGLYVDLLGSNYSLGGNAVGMNIANTSKTLQTYFNPGSTGININGLNFSYTADTYLLGGEYATKSAAIGVKGSRTATPEVQVGSDFAVVATTPGSQTHKIRVFIPGVGVRYIPVYS